MAPPSPSIAIAALCLGGAHAAYLQPAAAMSTAAPTRPGAAAHVQMVASKEIFSKYVDEAPSVQKTLTKVPTTVVDGGTAAAIAATAAAGFALTPSSRLAVNVVGGALGSTFGVFGRNKVVQERKKAAQPAVAALLAGGLQGVTPDKLASIMKEYGVEKAEFQSILGEMYLAYFDACLASPTVETSELSELLRLQDVLRLTPAQVGNKAYAAARNLYSRHRAYLEDTEDNESKRILNKFVFLAERVLSADESEEGYRYETLRLQKQFGILANEWKAIAEKEATPFYEKALGSAVLDGKPVTGEQLAAVRASLGITDGTASAMHLEVLNTLATTLLNPEAADEAKLSASESERLTQAAALLGVSAEALSDTLAALTTPLYKATFAALAAEPPAEVDERTVAQFAGALSLRQQELLLADDKVREVESDVLRAAATSYVSEATKFVRVQNVGAALLELRKLVNYASQMSAIMVEMSRVSGDDAFDTLFASLDRGDSKASEVLSLYKVFLLSSLEELKISEADSEMLSQLKLLLGITDQQSESVYEATAGPIFRKAVVEAVDGSMDVKSKVAIQQTLVDLALPESITSNIQLDVYSEKLKAKTEIKKIVDEDEAAKLVELRDFLDLTFDAVEPVHAEVFKPAYTDAVEDVFKQSLPVPDELWEGLEQLQERLGLSQASADSLFAKAAETKMQTLGQTAVDALEAKGKADQAAARRETGASTPADEKGDLNIDVKAGEKMLDEILAMIKFAEGTRVLQESGIACSLRGKFEEKTLRELYRQFLIEAFSGKSEEANERIFANMGKLALVVGLKPEEVKVIHDDLGSAIYRQVCNKALQDGPLGMQARKTLESIKDTLDMEQAKCDALIADCQLFRVSTMVEQMFERSSLTAEDSRKVRDMAEMLDVDLLNDAKINKWRLERMYIVELQDIIDAGELTPENTAELQEICEPLHIDEETAARLLEEVVSKRCAGGLLQAAALLRQNNQSSALEELERMLKFAMLSPDIGEVSAKSVSMRERNELALLYQASSLTAGSLDDAAKEKLDLLRQIAGLGN